MKKLADYNFLGWIGHYDENGHLEFGDGSARLGSYYIAKYIWTLSDIEKVQIMGSFKERYLDLWINDKELVRFPNKLKDDWYSRPGTMSRDNLLPLICGLLIMGPFFYSNEILRLFKILLARGFFTWNTKKIGQHDDKWKVPDWCGPVTWGLFFRAFCLQNIWLAFILYPVIVVCDLFHFLSCLIRIIVGVFNKDDVGDDLNTTIICAAHKFSFHTPVSMLASIIYFGLRPQAGDSIYRSQHPQELGAQSAWGWYYNNDQAPPLDELWKPIIGWFL